MKLEESTCLTSNNTTKLVIKKVWYWHKNNNINRSVEQNRKPEIIHAPMDTLSLTKKAEIYNGEKTISLTSGAGKTGQPLVKE